MLLVLMIFAESVITISNNISTSSVLRLGIHIQLEYGYQNFEYAAHSQNR